MTNLINKTFVDFDTAEKHINDYCRTNAHPVRIDSKEKVFSYNKKVKEDSRITCLPNDAVYACRYVHLHECSNICYD